MAKVGIVIDRWKLPIFTRHLKEAGFAYTEEGSIAADTLVLAVQVSGSMDVLSKVVGQATLECKNAKRP